GQRLNLCAHLSIDQNLTVECLIAKARCKVCDSPRHRILKSPSKPDASEGSVAMGNANPKPELMVVLTPFPNYPRDLGPHLHSHPHGYSRWVVTRKRIVKQDQKTVAAKAFYSALKLVN